VFSARDTSPAILQPRRTPLANFDSRGSLCSSWFERCGASDHRLSRMVNSIMLAHSCVTDRINMFGACGEKPLKTLLAIEPGDSIVGVARKIDENRETIRRVVNTLEDEGYVEYDDGLHVVDHEVREAGLSFLAASADVSPPTISRRTSSPLRRDGLRVHIDRRGLRGPAAATRSHATPTTTRSSSQSTKQIWRVGAVLPPIRYPGCPGAPAGRRQRWPAAGRPRTL